MNCRPICIQGSSVWVWERGSSGTASLCPADSLITNVVLSDKDSLIRISYGVAVTFQ